MNKKVTRIVWGGFVTQVLAFHDRHLVAVRVGVCKTKIAERVAWLGSRSQLGLKAFVQFMTFEKE